MLDSGATNGMNFLDISNVWCKEDNENDHTYFIPCIIFSSHLFSRKRMSEASPAMATNNRKKS
jgi:hypothetical protein